MEKESAFSDFHTKNINFLFSHMYSGFLVIDILQNKINLLIMNKCVVKIDKKFSLKVFNAKYFQLYFRQTLSWWLYTCWLLGAGF